MAMSWHMMVEFEPPLVACIVSNANYSFAALRATKECVIAVPALKLASKVVAVGNCSGLDMDKFKRFGLTPAPAERVAPPLVAECFANFECKVADTRLVNKYNLLSLKCSRHGSIRRKRTRRPFTIMDMAASLWMAR